MEPISRRRLLGQAGLLGTTLAAGLPLAAVAEPSAAASSAAPRKLRVVVTGGHPGDPEYGCGGTIARYTDLGHEVVLLYLNRGDPAETASHPASGVRPAEAAKACEILRARLVFAGRVAELGA